MSDRLIKELKATRKPLHAKCEGCERAEESGLCGVYYDPSAKWREKPVVTKAIVVNSKTLETKEEPAHHFYCPMATHLEVVEPEIHNKLNPIKASKRRGW
jgi:hypothetical protein